jgi:N-acetyl-alpha-D-muramate 1-phosphate uridylyltransferase
MDEKIQYRKANMMVNHALIIAAGLGTRLRPITLDVPKALVKVNGLTLLEHATNHIRTHNESMHLYVNTHYLADSINQFVNQIQDTKGVQITQLHEPEILDVGGAIKNAFIQSGCEHLLAHNVDSLFYGNPFLTDFIASYNPKYNIYLCLYPKSCNPFPHEGDFDILGDKAIFSKGGHYIYTGLAIYSRNSFTSHSQTKFSWHDIALDPSNNLGYYIMEPTSHWLDIGTPERLEYANNLKNYE